MGLNVTYKGSQIAQLTEDGNLKLETAGKYCEGDIELAYSGGGGVDWDDFISHSIPDGPLVLDTSTNIPNSIFISCSNITSLSAPLVTSIGNNSFQYCNGLMTLNLPIVETIGSSAFERCWRVRGGTFPQLTTINTNGLYGCGQLAGDDGGIWVFPKLATLGSDALRQIKADKVDIGPDLAYLPNRTFYNQQVYELILRRTAGVVAPSRADSIFSITSESKVYVPADLISSYEQETNWSTKGSIFYAIEGSQYEHYYADGTPIE